MITRGFNTSEALKYPGITGQIGRYPGIYPFFLNKGKLTTKKNLNCISILSLNLFYSTNFYLCITKNNVKLNIIHEEIDGNALYISISELRIFFR